MINIENYIKSCSDVAFNCFSLVNKVTGKPSNLEWFKLYRFTKKISSNKFNINENMKIMIINNGQWNYNYFNIAFLNNVIGNMIYCLSEGYIPYINIKSKDTDKNIWEMYFEQPYKIEIEKKYYKNSVKCPVNQSVFRPTFYNIYIEDELKLWGQVYNKFIKFNHDTEKYIEGEYNRLIKNDMKVLGVLCRGTDYTTTKPKCHPIQPSVEEVIEFAKKTMSKFGYDYIYLATDEKRIEEQFKKVFPNKVITNKRKYYDDIYYSNDNIKLIGQVHFNRDNDDYYKGLEYLSSLVILSRCSALIGGNCGGTSAALYMNNMKYEYTYIFNLGLYGIDD